jgi:hypothetical protein
MDQLQKQNDLSRTISQQSSGIGSSSELVVEVACDDRLVRFPVDGCETVAQIRSRALQEMQMIDPDSRRYIVIDSNRQPVRDQQTIDEILSQSQALCFRLVPQVAFGSLKMSSGDYRA